MGLTQIDDRGLKTPIDLLDSEKIRFGTGTDLEIYSGGAGGKIHCNNGVLEIEADSFEVWNHAANEAIAKFAANGSVSLYYDNSEKLLTQSIGARVNGRLYTTDYIDCKGHFYLSDSKKAVFGGGSDLTLYHDGSNSFIDSITGSLKIRSNNGNMAVFTPDGAVELYHNEVKTFETTSDGWKSVDGFKGVWGTGDDLQIWHDAGAGSNIRCSGSKLEIRSDSLQLQSSAAEKYLVGTANGAVELYYDNSKKLNTNADGVTISNGSLYLGDYSSGDGSIELGAGQDLKIYHDGSNSYIQNSTGNFQLTCDEFRVKTLTGTEPIIQASINGDVQLFYDNTKRFETTADGCTIQKGIKVVGEEDGVAQIRILADEGDDNADTWRLISQTNGNFDIESHYTNSWVTALGIRISSQDTPQIQAPKGGIKFDIDNTHTDANFGSFDGDGHLGRVGGQAILTADDYFRIRDLDNAEDKRFEFNTDSGNAGALNDWQDDQFDFAEMFEWSDGNPNDEDRIGHTVAIDGVTGKIKIAETGDTVIGVVSGTAAFTANCAGLYWHNAYLRDEWGRYEYDYIKDEDGNTVYNDPDNGNVRPKKKLKKNPDWDQERSYHRRTDRKEWDKIGIIGQCYVRKTAVIPSGWIKLKEIDSKKDFYLIK